MKKVMAKKIKIKFPKPNPKRGGVGGGGFPRIRKPRK